MFSLSQQDFQSGREYFRKLELRYFAVVSVPLIWLVVTYLGKHRTGRTVVEQNYPVWVFWLAMAVVLFTIWILYKVLRRKVGAIPGKAELSLRERMVVYAKINLNMYLMLGVVSLGLVSVYHFMSYTPLASMYTAYLIVISLERPTPARMARHLRLNKEMRDLIMTEQRLQDDITNPNAQSL